MVQLLLADPPSYQRWMKKLSGVATFIKDNQKRSYFIRIYDLRVFPYIIYSSASLLRQPVTSVESVPDDCIVTNLFKCFYSPFYDLTHNIHTFNVGSDRLISI